LHRKGGNLTEGRDGGATHKKIGANENAILWPAPN